MTALLGLITGPLGRILAGVLGAAALAGLGLWAVNTVRDGWAAEANVAVLMQAQTDLAKSATETVDALTHERDAAVAQANASATIKGMIHAATPSTSCGGSAAVRAALAGLRQRAAAHGAVVHPGAAGAAAVPAGAAAAGGPGH